MGIAKLGRNNRGEEDDDGEWKVSESFFSDRRIVPILVAILKSL
jgi:hypothetical protein